MSRSSPFETKTRRLKLPVSKKPTYVQIAQGISLGYRRNESAGSWVVRCADGAGSNWIKAFSQADDFDDADGVNVLDYWQAVDKAKVLARGDDTDTGRPESVREAIRDYGTDLSVRGAGPTNAARLLPRLPPSLLSKTVSTLTVKELRNWRNGLLTDGLKASSVNRLCKSLKAALNLAAEHDDRIANTKAWRTGLAAIPETDDTESNIVLSDEQRRAIVVAAYEISPDFGIYIETHAATGARSIQIASLNVGDLETGATPRLQMPGSLKGRNKRTRTRKPVPISSGLALRLKKAATGRNASEPLLPMDSSGRRWTSLAHYKPFIEAAEIAGLPEGATAYSLRHTAITRALLANVPVRLVASSFDTGIAMIEKTYSKYISDHGDAQMRRTVFDVDAPTGDDKVTPLRGR